MTMGIVLVAFPATPVAARAVHHDVHLELNQLGCKSGRRSSLPLGAACLNHEILTFEVAEFPEIFSQGCDTNSWRGRRAGDAREIAYPGRLSPPAARRQRAAARADQGRVSRCIQGLVPHGSLLVSASYQPSSFLRSRTLALTCCRKRERRTSGRCRQSGAALCWAPLLCSDGRKPTCVPSEPFDYSPVAIGSVERQAVVVVGVDDELVRLAEFPQSFDERLCLTHRL